MRMFKALDAANSPTKTEAKVWNHGCMQFFASEKSADLQLFYFVLLLYN